MTKRYEKFFHTIYVSLPVGGRWFCFYSTTVNGNVFQKIYCGVLKKRYICAIISVTKW